MRFWKAPKVGPLREGEQRAYGPLLLHLSSSCSWDLRTWFCLEEVKGSPASGGTGHRPVWGPARWGTELPDPGWQMLRRRPSHVVAVKVADEPGSRKAPECFQNPCSPRPLLHQEAQNWSLSGLEGTSRSSNPSPNLMPPPPPTQYRDLPVQRVALLRELLASCPCSPSRPQAGPSFLPILVTGCLNIQGWSGSQTSSVVCSVQRTTILLPPPSRPLWAQPRAPPPKLMASHGQSVSPAQIVPAPPITVPWDPGRHG